MDETKKRAYIIAHIHEAIEKKQLEVYYQPIIRTMTKSVTAFSCYIRYHDPEYGMIMPDECIPVLEEAGLCHLVDLYVFEEICKKIKEHQNAEIQVRFLMTMSYADFQNEEYLPKIKALLETYHVSPTMIRIYFKEYEVIDRQGNFLPYIREMMSLGFTFWITEYTRITLKYHILNDPHICGVTLSPFMVGDDPTMRMENQSVMRLNFHMQCQTLAIGVESLDMVDWLSSYGCERLQGNYYCPPLPYNECISTMHEKGLICEDIHYTEYYDKAEKTVDFFDGSALSLIEYDGLHVKILGANDNFMSILKFLGMTSLDDLEAIYNGTNSRLSRFLHSHLDRIVSGEDGHLVVSEQFGVLNFKVSFVSKNRGDYILKLIMEVMQKDDRELYKLNANKMFATIYHTFESFSFIDLTKQRVIMTSLNEASGLLEYSEFDLDEEIGRYQSLYIHPDDQKRFLAFFDIRTVMARIYENKDQIICDAFRTKKGDHYETMIYVLKYATDENRDILISYAKLVDPEVLKNMKLMPDQKTSEHKKTEVKIPKFEISLEEMLMKMSDYAHDYDDLHRNFTVGLIRLPLPEDYVVEHKDVTPYMYQEKMIHLMKEALEPLNADPHERTYLSSLHNGTFMILSNVQNTGFVDLVFNHLRGALENSEEVKNYDENYKVMFYVVHASDLRYRFVNTYVQMLEKIFSYHEVSAIIKSEEMVNFSPIFTDPKTGVEFLNELPFAMAYVKNNKRIALWNSAAEQLTGFTADMMLDHPIEYFSNRFFTEKENTQVIHILDPLKTHMTGFFKVRDGYRVEIALQVLSLHDPHRKLIGSLIIFRRLNNLEFSEHTLQYLYDAAINDPLTKLPRRNYITDFLKGCIAANHASDRDYAILFTDLNGFGYFNNTYGHEAGDLVLEAFGKTLLKQTRDTDCVGRWGGDEFIAILRLHTIHPDTLKTIAKRYQDICKSVHIDYQGVPLKIDLSIGITRLRKDDDIETVIKRADSYMYIAKRHTSHHIITDENCDQYD